MIEDYKQGLQASLYLSVHEPTKTWQLQSPPTNKHQKGKPVYELGNGMPNFGKYLEKREQIIQEIKLKEGPINEKDVEEAIKVKQNRREYNTLQCVPKIQTVLGSSLKQIVNYTDLDPQQQVVAKVDEVIRFDCFFLYFLFKFF